MAALTTLLCGLAFVVGWLVRHLDLAGRLQRNLF